MIDDQATIGWPERGWFRLLGFRLGHPLPLGDTYLPLSAGVHAIYGPNGVGKTKVLEGVQGVLTGSFLKGGNEIWDDSSILFFEWSWPEEADSSDDVSMDSSSFVRGLRENLDFLFGRPWGNENLDGLLGDLASGASDLHNIRNPLELIEIFLRVDDTEIESCVGLGKEFAKEIAHGGYMAVSVKEDSSADRFYVCIDEQSASPRLREAIVETFRLAREAEGLEGLDDCWPNSMESPDAMCLPLSESCHAGHWREQESRPGWAPIVFTGVGASDMGRKHVIWVGSEVEYVEGQERSGVTEVIREMSLWLGGSPTDLFEKELTAEAKQLLEAANRFYEMILGKPTRLKIEIGGPAEMVAGTHPRVVALDAATSSWVPLDLLSATEARWAKVAFFLAWHELSQSWGKGVDFEDLVGDVVLLIDEPELGLRSGTQRQLSRGLVALSEMLDIPVIVATHSAALLDDLAVNTFRCSRNDDGMVRLDEVLPTDRDALQKLGVPISEELNLYKLVLIVEGRHEQVLLDEMFGEEIAANRIKLLPIRGVRQLRLLAAGSEVLFRYLEAPFVLLTDRTRTEAATTALAAATSGGDPGEVRKAIEDAFDAASDEEQVLKSLLISAAESDRIDRIRAIHGFEKDDVLHYLPCEHFVPGSDWDELLELHKGRPTGEPNDFKRWLELTKNVDLSDENLRTAVRQMDHIPIEWTELLNRCAEIVNAQEGS